MPNPQSPQASLPAAGIGLRHPHIPQVRAQRPGVGWLEVHAENYMNDGPAGDALDIIRRDYPVSLHGVGLSIGSVGGFDRAHLKRLRAVVDRFEPAFVSEHLSWSGTNGLYLNDLLPLPMTQEALDLAIAHVLEVQDVLRRPILIENPSRYLAFADEAMTEPEFLADLAWRTGCSILLDINNVFVSAHNLTFDPVGYLDALIGTPIGEFHLAGHQCNQTPDGPLLIDDHGSRVSPGVWSLFADAVRRFGPRPTLIEWDSRLPDLTTLVDEAARADVVVAVLTGGFPNVRAA